MSWKKKKIITRFYVGVWIEFSFIHERFSHCLFQCQMTKKIVFKPFFFSIFYLILTKNSSRHQIIVRQSRLVAWITGSGNMFNSPDNNAKYNHCVFYYFAHTVCIDEYFWKGEVCSLSKDSNSNTSTAWCCAQRSSFDSAEIMKRLYSLCHLEKRQCDTNLPI